MAASHFDDDRNDDSDFDDYNPHPYQGGYDLILTYGQPIPPSPSTCYPLPSGSPPPESAHLPPPESAHRPPPEPAHLPPPEPAHRPPSPPPEPSPTVPYDYLESGHRPPSPPPEPNPTVPYDYLGSGHRPESYWSDLGAFGFWPFEDEGRGGCRGGGDVEEVGYWNYPKRAGDYLFGYSEGYGEKRIGVDSYGVPIYANRKGASEAVTRRVEAARDLKVECYESGDNVSMKSCLITLIDKCGICLYVCV